MDERARVAAERWSRHGLADRGCRDVLAAVARTSALQAQDTPASYLGVRARTADATETAVVGAVDTDRTIVRTWLMRGTIHLVHTHDLRWLVRLIGPSIQRKYRTRWRRIGLADHLLDASVAALSTILAAGPLDRHEIQLALREHGIVIDSQDTQALTHLILHACTTGLVCRGPDRGRTSTFVLSEDWVPQAPEGPSGDDALAELARRYFAAYSPATAADFTTWSGLAATRAIALVRDELSVADVDGRPGYRLGEAEPLRGLRLLPAFDNYVLGYRERARIVPLHRHGEVYAGGMIKPTLGVDGQVVGTWRLDGAGGRVQVRQWRALTSRERHALDAEAADIGRFVGRDLALEVTDG